MAVATTAASSGSAAPCHTMSASSWKYEMCSAMVAAAADQYARIVSSEEPEISTALGRLAKNLRLPRSITAASRPDLLLK